MSIQERDYAAAAEAVRNASRLIDEAIMVGDGTIPEELQRYAIPGEPFWDAETQAIKRLAKEGKRTNGVTEVVAMHPIGAHTPNLVRLYVCVDGRMVVTINEDGSRHRNGALVAARLMVRKSDDAWRVQGYETNDDGTLANFQPVSECAEDPA